jgi:hypothetical protein
MMIIERFCRFGVELAEQSKIPKVKIVFWVISLCLFLTTVGLLIGLSIRHSDLIGTAFVLFTIAFVFDILVFEPFVFFLWYLFLACCGQTRPDREIQELKDQQGDLEAQNKIAKLSLTENAQE